MLRRNDCLKQDLHGVCVTSVPAPCGTGRIYMSAGGAVPVARLNRSGRDWRVRPTAIQLAADGILVLDWVLFNVPNPNQRELGKAILK